MLYLKLPLINIKYKLYMQTNNRSGLQCPEHPREQITNYCIKSLKPLCPDCVEIHTKNVDSQDILSWKHCVNKNIMVARNSLQELKAIYDLQRQSKGFKSIQTIQSQNIQKLYNLRQKYHKLIDDIFNTHERNLRNQIRSQYKISENDTSKLKAAIQQMEKLIVKMTNMTTVLGALKKCLLLDHKSLVEFFADLKNPTSKTVTQRFFTQNNSSFNDIKTAIQRCINLQNFNIEHEKIEKRYQSPQINKAPYASNSGMEQNDPFKPIKIYNREYFKSDCRNKLLHFFIPCSTQLKILKIQDAQRGEWRSIKFNAKKSLPYYFKSVITSSGDIYLTGGSQEQQRCKEIYRYNFQKNLLQYIGDMIYQRSSHSICSINDSIYIIGGFTQSQGQATRYCQVFNLNTLKSSQMAPLNTPSANSCVTSFKDQYIFKFGGIFNKFQGNSLIQMYSIKNNRWIVVNIDVPKNIHHLELLSYSAAIQYNQSQILVFGGYDNSEIQKPQRLCYSLSVMIDKNLVQVKNYNTTPLPYAEAFWDNNPIVYHQKIYALQNITDEQDELTALADERRVIIFNGQRWL